MFDNFAANTQSVKLLNNYHSQKGSISNISEIRGDRTTNISSALNLGAVRQISPDSYPGIGTKMRF